ncbi:MAG TPA: 7-cyano-7-deazaguanine synthase QueC [Candidatus Edwardsbacteria bacterium]|nr:7-cyano-7-deazaguanine synthase QueC [Candidatus Edwardsbacteria bacterium]
MARRNNAVVLLSGGLDSATVLYWAKDRGYEPHALLFDYGQRHDRELRSAMALCRRCRADYELVRFNLPWQGSSLLDPAMKVPQPRSAKAIGKQIPSTYVPARNTIFLAFGLSYAEAIGAGAVMIGANALDYSGYPDCRPDYIRAMAKAFKLGTKTGREGRAIKIVAPLVKMSKSRIIKLGMKLGVPYELTWSCYRGGAKPCGRCDSCLLRAKGFAGAGLPDPALTGEQAR